MSDTDKASPRPWSVGPRPIGGAYWIASAANFYIGLADEQADAALIVEAVNERDRLRDLVRRLADAWENSLRESGPRAVEALADPHNLANALLREARAAVKESEK